MAKPNVQILRIWTFATGLLNMLRRPSIFLPSHIWLGEKNVRKKRESGEISEEEKISKSEKTTVPSGHRSLIGARKERVKHANRKNGRPLRFTARRANPFMRFARRAVNLRGPRKKKIEDRCPERTVVSPISKKSEENPCFSPPHISYMAREKQLPYFMLLSPPKIACDFRGGPGRQKKRGSPQHVEETLVFFALRVFFSDPNGSGKTSFRFRVPSDFKGI